MQKGPVPPAREIVIPSELLDPGSRGMWTGQGDAWHRPKDIEEIDLGDVSEEFLQQMMATFFGNTQP